MSGRRNRNNNKAPVAANPVNVVVPAIVAQIEKNVAGQAPVAGPSVANNERLAEVHAAAKARRQAQEKARKEALAKAEAARVEAARVEAARVEAARVEAEIEAARVEELRKELEVEKQLDDNGFDIASPALSSDDELEVDADVDADADEAPAPAPSRLARFGRALLAAAGVAVAGGAAYLANQARVARNRNAYGPAFGPEASENAADEVVRRDLATKTPAEVKAIREAIHQTQNDGYCDFANGKAPRDLRGQPRHLVVAYKEGFEKHNPPTIDNSVNNTKFKL